MAGQCSGCTADPWDVDDCWDCVVAKTAPCNICEVIKDLPRRYENASNPTVNDDVTLGYKWGDIWKNTTDNGVFICVDETDGAAVWKEFTFV